MNRENWIIIGLIIIIYAVACGTAFYSVGGITAPQTGISISVETK